MKGLNLSQFKKISSDDKSTTLKHPEGHKIVIAHHALSPEHKKQLKELPTKYADGGEVEKSFLDDLKGAASDAKETWNDYAPPDQTPSGVDFASQYNAPAEAPAPSMMRDPASVAPPVQASPAPQAQAAPQASLAPPQAPNDPMGMEAYGNTYMKGLNEQKAGIYQQAAAEGAQGKREVAAEQEMAQFAQKAQADYQKHYQDLQAEYQGVMHDVQNQLINPNHYMESMSSGKKVATMIGLALSGWGAAFTGQNPVQNLLKEQIDRDVDTQKANLGKSENLLSANLHQFGNLHDATQMTYAMQQGIYSSKLKQAAAQAMDPLAKARALQMAGQLDAQAAPVLQQLAMKKAAMGAMNSAGDPAAKIRVGTMVGIIPKEESDHLYKELEEAQNMVKARDNILGAFDKISKLQTFGNRAMNPIQSGSQIAAIRDPLVAGLSKETAGRFTEQDAKFLEGLFPNATDNDKTVAMKKNAIEKLVSQKMHFPRLQAFGVNPYGEQRYGDGGQKKIQLGPPVR